MSTMATINAGASKAQIRAEADGAPYLVTYLDGVVRVVPAAAYEEPRHGAIERVRYPDGYVHPDPKRRLW